MRRLAVIVPTLNEQRHIGTTLEPLQALRRRGHQVIVVDGGSIDATVAACAGRVDRLLRTPAGRAHQMNAGARAASGDVLVFLHADTRAPETLDALVLRALDGKPGWGRFDVRLSGTHPLLRLVERLMNLRSRLSGIATGDQGIFVTRTLFETLGGFPELPLMEDIALSKKLRRTMRPHCLRNRLLTSSRRWESGGVMRTVVTMWSLRLAYFLGVSAERLARHYD